MEKVRIVVVSLLPLFSTFIWQKCAAEPMAIIWGTETNGFQMSIGLANGQNQVTNGESCVLQVRYQNVSTNETFRVSEMNPDPRFSFVIISPSGRDVSPDIGKILYGDAGANVVILPNQTAEDTFDFSAYCHFNENGAYKIIAKKRDIWCVEQKKIFQAISNPLFVKVVPKR